MSLTSTGNSAAPSNIVSHIRDMLPLQRRAVFHVKLVIHQLSNVPLMSGQFRIKWKFHNLQAVNSAGRPLGLGRALALRLEKRKGKEVAQPDSNDDRENEENEDDSPTPEESPAPYGRPGSSYSSGRSTHSKSSFNSPSETNIDYRPDARGYTPFLPLRDFKVSFDQQIDVAVQMSIDKESLALLPSDLKLTVMQRVIQGDPDSPLNPRLGHIELNLAEYADAGSVTRNYLLRRSKVNAVLNMTIAITQISGEDNYRAPPLRPEEIGAGIAHFVSVSEPLPALSRFRSIEDPWLADSLDHFPPQQEDPPPDPPPSDTAEIPVDPRKRWRNAKRSTSDGASNPLPQKPISREELSPTEALIEAIFNPYPTTSTAESPFTYYVAPAPTQPSDSPGTDGTSRWSFDSSPQASGSASEQGHDTGGGSSGSGIGGNKRWRIKAWAGSRPGTPARSNSTRS